MDYSIFDAIEAGFNKVVFIIRKEIEEDFMNIIGRRIQKYTEVEYVIQSITNLPEGFECPDGRTKPWGTAHAVLCCKDIIKEPFAVINADDYYGKKSFKIMHDYLISDKLKNDSDCGMVGFVLKNTLSENGGVTRGICQVNEQNKLSEILETKNLHRDGDRALGNNATGSNIPVDLESIVSMNMWGFGAPFMKLIETEFIPFLEKNADTDLQSEYLLPVLIGDLIKQNRTTVEVLKTDDTWFGVTYKEDKEEVVKSFKELVEQGIYPKRLFPE